MSDPPRLPISPALAPQLPSQRQQHARAKQVFLLAQDAPPGPDRDRIVSRECGGDEVLSALVRSLLASGPSEPLSSWNRPVLAPSECGSAAASDGVSPLDLSGAMLGRYTLGRLIARGGMGAVYEAEQDEPRRTVALKLLDTGAMTHEGVRRFRHEAAALARLQHPGIATVFDAGVLRPSSPGAWPLTPVPYIAMERIPGAVPITEWCRERRISLVRRVELLAEACDAVHHGHQRGVIHRDLKPANILVGDDERARIIDFGIARLTDSDVEATQRTSAGELIGTLRYMSPEQFDADPSGIDTRTDVYSLGLVLYELIADRSPFDLHRTSLARIAEVVRNVEPPPPLPRSRANRDLNTLVLKTLEKDRERRYGSVADLAADLRRWLRHDVIAARAPTRWYVLSRFCRRNRLAVSAAAVVVMALLCAVIISGLSLRRANIARAAERARADELDRQLYRNSILVAQESLAKADTAAAELRLRGSVRRPERWELRHLDHIGRSAVTGARHAESLAFHDCFVMHPASSWGAVLARTEVRILDAGSMTYNGPRIECGPGWHGLSLDVSLVDTRLALACDDGRIRIFDASTGAESFSFRANADKVGAVAFSPRSDVLYTGDWSRCIKAWDPSTGRQLMQFLPHDDVVNVVKVSPDGTLLASCSYDGTTRLWRADTGAAIAILTRDSHPVTSVAFTPNGGALAVPDPEGGIRLFDTATGTLARRFSGVSAPMEACAFSPDGLTLAASDTGGSLHLWDAAGGRRLGSLGSAIKPCFGPDPGRILAVVASELHDLDACAFIEPSVFLGQRADGVFAGFSPDGSLILTDHHEGGVVTVWNADSGARVCTWRWTNHQYARALWLPDGKRFVAWAGRTVRTVDAAAAQLLNEAPLEWEPLEAGALSVDGSRLALARPGGGVALVDPRTGATLAAVDGPVIDLQLVFNRDSSLLAGCSASNRSFTVWTADLARIVPHHQQAEGDAYEAVEFDPLGRFVAAVTPSSLRRFDLTTGALLSETPKMPGSELAISPDGARIVVLPQVFDGADGKWICDLRIPDLRSGSRCGFSPDGRTLVAPTTTSPICILETEPPACGYRLRFEVAEAQRACNRLFDQFRVQKDVLRAAAADPGISPRIRLRVLDLARDRNDDPHDLNSHAWMTVRFQGASDESIRLALREAQVAAAARPSDGLLLNTLGAAEYRAGLPDRAAETLTRAADLNAASRGKPFPEDLAFLAMAHAAAGRPDEALLALDRCRGLLEGVSPSDELSAILGEAEHVVIGTPDAR